MASTFHQSLIGGGGRVPGRMWSEAGHGGDRGGAACCFEAGYSIVMMNMYPREVHMLAIVAIVCLHSCEGPLGAAVRPRPLQHLQVPALSGTGTPWAVMLPRPLQHLQLTFLSGGGTGRLIPRTALLPQPLQHLRLPAHSCLATDGTHSPWAAMLPRPLQRLQLSVMSGSGTSRLVPWAVVLPRPPQHIQVPSLSNGGTYCLIQRAPVLPRPPQHGNVPVLSSCGSHGSCCCCKVPVLPHPPQHIQVPARSGGAHTSSHPTGTRACAPTSTPPSARP